jgi:hypothetical protein
MQHKFDNGANSALCLSGCTGSAIRERGLHANDTDEPDGCWLAGNFNCAGGQITSYSIATHSQGIGGRMVISDSRQAKAPGKTGDKNPALVFAPLDFLSQRPIPHEFF